MKTKNQSDPTKRLSGKLTINSEAITASEIEISPAGNEKYAITIRTIVNHTPEVPKEDMKGNIRIIYEHPFLDTMRFVGHLLDFGVNDRDNDCILSLFFSCKVEPSPIIPAKLLK